jgi:hypothetical protein
MSVAFEYVGDDEREIPDARLIVKPGDIFEVDADLAKGLEGQTSLYKKATAKPKAPTAPKAPKDGDQ